MYARGDFECHSVHLTKIFLSCGGQLFFVLAAFGPDRFTGVSNLAVSTVWTQAIAFPSSQVLLDKAVK